MTLVCACVLHTNRYPASNIPSYTHVSRIPSSCRRIHQWLSFLYRRDPTLTDSDEFGEFHAGAYSVGRGSGGHVSEPNFGGRKGLEPVKKAYFSIAVTVPSPGHASRGGQGTNA